MSSLPWDCWDQHQDFYLHPYAWVGLKICVSTTLLYFYFYSARPVFPIALLSVFHFVIRDHFWNVTEGGRETWWWKWLFLVVEYDADQDRVKSGKDVRENHKMMMRKTRVVLIKSRTNNWQQHDMTLTTYRKGFKYGFITSGLETHTMCVSSCGRAPEQCYDKLLDVCDYVDGQNELFVISIHLGVISNPSSCVRDIFINDIICHHILLQHQQLPKCERILDS